MSLPGVSFVIPVRNGRRWLAEVLAAVLAQDDGRPLEVLVIDDRSSDGSREIVEGLAGDARVRLLDGEGRGATAALNLGIRSAKHPLIAQVDQDVILDPGWLARLSAELDDPRVAAAQGAYRYESEATILARVSALDLEMRYARLQGSTVDHLGTGCTLYRADALHQVGLFDESLGYGYDNDLSYRLGQAGHRLVLCRQASSVHRWPETLSGHLRQQYGLGYGRLDVIAKHPRRIGGDQVSGPGMILRAPAMLATVVTAVVAAGLAMSGRRWFWWAAAALAVLFITTAERLLVAVGASLRFRDPAGLLLAPLHLLRDLVWVLAVVRWTWRRVMGQRARPDHSMSGS